MKENVESFNCLAFQESFYAKVYAEEPEIYKIKTNSFNMIINNTLNSETF